MGSGWVSTNHHRIGLRYLWLALSSVCLGMVLSLVLRPDGSGASAILVSAVPVSVLHGTLMVFFVLSIAPQAGLGTYLLPLQIGAREMAFPRLTAFAFWLVVASFITMSVAFGLRAEHALTLWVGGVLLFCTASVCNGLNFAVTALDLRSKGMSLPRLPVTAWAWMVNAVLSLLIYSVLAAVCIFVLSDRIFGANLIGSAPQSLIVATGNPLEWQRLFWFFAQAQVYIAILPCFGIVTHLLATFARRPVWNYFSVALALCAAGLLDFCIVGERLFASGLDPGRPLPFGVLAALLGVPGGFLVVVWLRTLWHAHLQLPAAVLFALGFVSLFLTGGFSGIFLARHDLRGLTANDALITGHFHLVMGVAATFALLAGLFFWFPRLFGRALDETLGKAHFWLTFVGVYAAFMSMHWTGLLEHSSTLAVAAPRSFSTFAVQLHRFTEAALLLTVASQALFLINFFGTLVRKALTEAANPWGAGTLEWIGGPQPALERAGDVTVYRGAYEFLSRASSPAAWPDLVPQHLTPEQAAGLEQQS
jgi:cytochrome c oxidase subunit 1